MNQRDLPQNPAAAVLLTGAGAGVPAGISPTNAAVVYVAAFITGAIVMSFEMLGSRYLNPYFGSGIYTWAALISTVLMALTVGYFLGGAIADRTPSMAVLALIVLVASAYLLALPAFAEAVLEFVLDRIDDIRLGSLSAALAIMFFPVALLGMYSPFAIRLLLRSALNSGRISGTVYGISTAGSIVRNTRHHVPAHSGDRLARHYARARRRRRDQRPPPSGAGSDRAARRTSAQPGGRLGHARSRDAGCVRRLGGKRHRTKPRARRCSSAPTAASPTSKPNTTISS